MNELKELFDENEKARTGYQEKRAAREHERMRRELWCAAYVAHLGRDKSDYVTSATAADIALLHFAEKFPAPI